MCGRLPNVARQARQPRKQHMSNAQPDTRGAGGERRRRRSRGGRGRNRNRQENGNESGGQFQNRGERGERGERQNRGDRDRNQNRGDRGNREDRGPRPPRKEFKPAPLKWWQKLLKAIGLYKEPVRPPRPERKESVRFEEGPPSGSVVPSAGIPPREVKSNTRNARQGGAEGGEREPRREREPRERGERGERGERSERGERRGGERSEVASARIYLGNLSYETTEEDLKDLFKGVGTVRNVEIVYNRRTHKSKGYGFVDMLNTEEAKRCVEVLHDQFFMGRKLVVSGAKSKEHEDALREETVEERPRAAAAAVVAPVAAAAVAEAVPVVEAVPAEIEAAPAAIEEAAAPAPEPEPAVEPVAEVAHEPAPAAEHHEEQTPHA